MSKTIHSKMDRINIHKFGLFFLFLLTYLSFYSQLGEEKKKFTHQDTLRGKINEERDWWNVLRYDITVQPNYEQKTISGKNIIRFEILKEAHKMQIDMQEPMQIDSVLYMEKHISILREGNIFHLNFSTIHFTESQASILIYFSGKPRQAINPPWDGGWIWKKDDLDRPWMSVACQGLGASVWYPCKDHQSDEPDQGASLTMIISDTLVAVSNGQLKALEKMGNGLISTTWEVNNPINTYNLIPYIGKYEHWGENYVGENGNLSCDYWVLDYELEKAKKQFRQVPNMLKCFEYWFGPYPFYEDGYKLVQSPFLGMEHQSAVAYGNRFRNGYLGMDLSGSGWGLKWDYIIIHESGHEWFGNNITTKDIADMWVHEGFTNYSETIYTDCEYGTKAGNEYEIGLAKSIRNDKPVIGQYDVNSEGSGDMYYKGSSLIHIIRQLINDDEKFRQLLRSLNSHFWHQTVTSKEVEDYIIGQTGLDLTKLFDQYLRTTKIPKLVYKIKKNTVSYRWENCVSGFDLKIRLIDGTWISPTEKWQTSNIENSTEFKIDPNFYIKVKQK